VVDVGVEVGVNLGVECAGVAFGVTERREGGITDEAADLGVIVGFVVAVNEGRREEVVSFGVDVEVDLGVEEAEAVDLGVDTVEVDFGVDTGTGRGVTVALGVDLGVEVADEVDRGVEPVDTLGVGFDDVFKGSVFKGVLTKGLSV
jgi:hypothetical protein